MDAISNMLSQLTNAQSVGKETVVIPHSQLKVAILEVLKRAGFVADVHIKGRRARKVIEVSLAYADDGSPRIRAARRVSKLSRRVYSPYAKLAAVRGGVGIQVVSTTGGVLAGPEARKQKLGGEVLCEVW